MGELSPMCRVGAVCSFVGTVRDRNDGSDITAMALEHYPGMTERAIEAMIDTALQRFDIRAARVVHRVGPLLPGEQIVLVAVSSAHRGQAFQPRCNIDTVTVKIIAINHDITKIDANPKGHRCFRGFRTCFELRD